VLTDHGVTDSILTELSDNDLREMGIDKFAERKRLLTAFAVSGVAQNKPRALGFTQDGQQGVMAFTTRPLRVVAFCGALLADAALEDGGIKIEAKALVRCGKMGQEPAPKGTPERLNGVLGKAGKKVANRIGTRKAGNTEHGMKGFICTQPVGVGKATCADNRREEKRHQGVGLRDGVRAAQPKEHELLNRVGETNFSEELYQVDEAPEWGDGFGSAAKMNLA